MDWIINALPLSPILNGLVGDQLAEKHQRLAIPMSFRIAGEDVSVNDLEPKVKGKSAVILVHGLMADELVWKYLGARLEKTFTVLYVRYNSGLHISQNGKMLSGLLDKLSRSTRCKRLLLAGHSMGGLVIRSACYYGVKRGLGWTRQVPLIFLISVPNAGAALEQLGHLVSYTLRKIAKWHLGTVGNILEQRSDGIKDLRSGAMVDADWKQATANLVGHPGRTPVPPMAGVKYHILVGSLSRNEKSMMTKYFGDGLVTPTSAVAQTLLKVSQIKIFPKSGHNSLLKDRRVYRYVKNALDAAFSG